MKATGGTVFKRHTSALDRPGSTLSLRPLQFACQPSSPSYYQPRLSLEVAPLVLEGEISIEASCQKWSFNGDEGQILRFEPRPKSGSHIGFGHVAIHLSLVDNERLQTADPEVIGWDEELREITLPETGTYTLEVEGNSDETSGAYIITISEQQP